MHLKISATKLWPFCPGGDELTSKQASHYWTVTGGFSSQTASKVECVFFSRHPLQWRHNERDGVSNHRRLESLPSRLFMRRSKKTSKLRVTGLCEGNSPVTGKFPAQRSSNVENVSIWWRHHDHDILSNASPLTAVHCIPLEEHVNCPVFP